MLRSEREAFEFYAAKAPVFQRRFGRDVQEQGRRLSAKSEFWHALLESEIRDLRVAVEHARAGEGRAEFDAVCARVRARLWP